MKEVYFENVHKIGDLYLEKVLNRFEDENIIFICNDNTSNKYLCLCYEFRYSLKWIITKIEIEDIVKLISKSIDIRSVYEKNINNLIHIIYENDFLQSQEISLQQLDKNILPISGILLKTNKEIDIYLHDLCRNCLIYKTYTYEKRIRYNIKIQSILNNTNLICNKTLSIPYDLVDKNRIKKEYSSINLEEAA